MLLGTKILVDEYRLELDSYKEFIEGNNWTDDVYIDEKTGKLKSNAFSTENSVINNVLSSIKRLLKDIGDDVTSKGVQDFLGEVNTIFEIHLNRIREYKKENPLNGDSTEADVEFHSELFSILTKMKLEMANLGIGDEKASSEMFHEDRKATMPMRKLLTELNPVIKNKVDDLSIDFASTIINPASSNEMFINMKPSDIPPWDESRHFFEQEKSTIQFWEEEMRKIRNGINVLGYHISPWLYWHLNHFMLTYIDEDTGDKVTKQPVFRDNEYYFNEMYQKAKEHGRCGLFMYGTRRFSKSVIESSFIGHGMYSIHKCQASLVGFSKSDIKQLYDYLMDFGEFVHPALKMIPLWSDPDKGMVLGLKGKSAQVRYELSRLNILNLEGGNTKKGGQKTAGGTPDVLVMDEALSEDSLLWTPEGSITMSDVKVGDSIYGADGNLTKVLDKIDVGVKPLYRLTLRNGNYVDACGDHLWEVKNKLSSKSRIEIKTTEELLSDYLKNGTRSRYSIRKACPIKFPFKEVGIDPYWLGLWLGDGDKRSTCITTIDDEIMDYVEKYSHKLNLLFKKKLLVEKHRKTPTYRVSMVKPNGSPNVIINQLRELNVLRNKHIPDIYKFNSVDVRLSVLQGLIDTDGTVCEKGRVDLTLGNKRLFDDTLWLIESLGIAASKVNIRTINGKDYYRVSFNTDLDVCRLSRKKGRRRAPLSKKGISNLKWVSLVDITPIGDRQAYCIKVDNEDKLFVTNNFMVTHNCGKGGIISPWLAAKASFAGGKGGRWRTIPILSGTAGDAELSADAEKLLKDPEGYSILPMNWDVLDSFVPSEHRTWRRGTKFATFVPAQMSLEGPPKVETDFASFLGKSNKELSKISMKVTDWEVKNKFFLEEREKLNNNLAAQASYMNSFPLEAEDCFITTEKNIFPGIECKNRKEFVEKEGSQGQTYRFYRNSLGKIVPEMVESDDLINVYPYEGGNIDSPIVMLEDPRKDLDEEPPLGLYVIGLDDIKVDTSSGESVASATVFKRMHGGGEWANRIVAYYDSRPDRKDIYYKQLYLMMKYYNARVLYENADNGFIEWVETHHQEDVHKHFSTGVGLASEENLHLNKNRKFGWTPTSQNIYLLHAKLVQYVREENVKIGAVEGLSGVDRINHPMLLEEMYKFKKDNNCDRIRSFGLAYTLAKYYDNTYQYLKLSNTFRPKDSNKRNNTRSSYGGLLYDERLNRRSDRADRLRK